MECGKLTAKLRDAVPVCFIENGKEVKRFKNIEIPDEIKKLPYQDFEFSVPVTGAITFKIIFEEGILPKVWPEARTRKSRKASPKEAPMPERIAAGLQAALEQAPERKVLSDALGAFREEDRQIVLLHAAAGLKHREVASALGLPLATELSKYNRSMKKLQKILQK